MHKHDLNDTWPVLKSYDQDHLRKIAMPVGGIGTGTVSLGGRGDLRDWEIVNKPAKGFTPGQSFFTLYVKPAGGNPVTRVLEGVIDDSAYEGASGCPLANSGLPRFRHCSFHAAYPLAQVLLEDPDVPLKVRMDVFNPLIPTDADASGIPVAVFRFNLINETDTPVDAAVCGNLKNFIGVNHVKQTGYKNNVNRFHTAGGKTPFCGLHMQTSRRDTNHENYGSMALATTSKSTISYWSNWKVGEWKEEVQLFWNDFSEDGILETDDSPPKKEWKNEAVVGSLATKVRVPANSDKTITFVMAWHFPNRQTWTPVDKGNNRIGNYYTTQYTDAWDVLKKTMPVLKTLERDTVRFVDAFCSADLPDVVKEAALFNLSSLRSQTCFRLESGHLMGFEGCWDDCGCCFGSCIHVWQYEQSTALLFGQLSKSLRDAEFVYGADQDGFIRFRIPLPLGRRKDQWNIAAADGQSGCIMKLYRDWQLSGDTAMLKKLWPKAKKLLAFCWIDGGWDSDQDGVMEGFQSNTMDVEYLGPNPLMQIWYLGALKSAAHMARYLKDRSFAERCESLYEQGAQWTDAHLFNGDYYEHHIMDLPKKYFTKEPRLRNRSIENTPEKYQLGKGCLVDQLMGQLFAHVCGLGYLVEPKHVKTTLKSIMKYNFKETLYGHVNNMRTYALNDESAMVMSTYPKGEKPDIPFPYHAESMTGFEYTAAIGMLYEGQIAAGLKCIKAVRDRFDGRKRNPFNEAEWGSHYVRAMIAWAAVPALTGFRYSAVEKMMAFANTQGTHFWSTGYAWGQCSITKHKNTWTVKLTVFKGAVTLKHFELTGVSKETFSSVKTINEGKTLTLNLKP